MNEGVQKRVAVAHLSGSWVLIWASGFEILSLEFGFLGSGLEGFKKRRRKYHATVAIGLFVRAKREELQIFQGRATESHRQNLALPMDSEMLCHFIAVSNRKQLSHPFSDLLARSVRLPEDSSIVNMHHHAAFDLCDIFARQRAHALSLGHPSVPG